MCLPSRPWRPFAFFCCLAPFLLTATQIFFTCICPEIIFRKLRSFRASDVVEKGGLPFRGSPRPHPSYFPLGRGRLTVHCKELWDGSRVLEFTLVGGLCLRSAGSFMKGHLLACQSMSLRKERGEKCRLGCKPRVHCPLLEAFSEGPMAHFSTP